MVCNGVGIAHAGNPSRCFSSARACRNSHVPAIAATLGVTAVFDVVAGGVLLGLVSSPGRPPGGHRCPRRRRSCSRRRGARAAAVVACWLSAAPPLARRGAASSAACWRPSPSCAAPLATCARWRRCRRWPGPSAWRCSSACCTRSTSRRRSPTRCWCWSSAASSARCRRVPAAPAPQQVAVVFALHGTASASEAITFSLGMQVAITLFNIGLGCIAAMVLFGTVRPGRLFRQARTVLAAARVPTPAVVPTPAPAAADAAP